MKLEFKWGRKQTLFTINGQRFEWTKDPVTGRWQVLRAVEQVMKRRLRFDEWMSISKSPVIDCAQDGTVEV